MLSSDNCTADRKVRSSSRLSGLAFRPLGRTWLHIFGTALATLLVLTTRPIRSSPEILVVIGRLLPPATPAGGRVGRITLRHAFPRGRALARFQLCGWAASSQDCSTTVAAT